jgi:hypothetical protein
MPDVIDRLHAEHAEADHRNARELMAEIRAAGFGSDEARSLAGRLRWVVTEHVATEERVWLPKLRTAMAEQLDVLGERVAARKSEIQRLRA